MFFIVVGFEFAISVIVGLVLGNYIDQKFNNQTPYFTLIGVIVGSFAGLILLLKLLKMNKNNEK